MTNLYRFLNRTAFGSTLFVLFFLLTQQNAIAKANKTSALMDGCTDPSAVNFDPEATTDDGSCVYHSYNETPITFELVESFDGIYNEGGIMYDLTGYHRYRIYANIGQGNFLSAIYSLEADAEVAPNYLGEPNDYDVQLGSTCECFITSPLTPPVFGDNVACGLEAVFSTYYYNPFLTIGHESECDYPGEQLSVAYGVEDNSELIESQLEQNMCGTTLDEFYLLALPPNTGAWADEDGKVLIGQVTTCGDPYFTGCFITWIGGDQYNRNLSCEAAAAEGVPGCMDPTAVNFDPEATIDVACSYEGCTDPEANNYNPNATTDDGSCELGGCTNSEANNYDPTATVDDGSCEIWGCTNPVATNYDDQANVDDGSCEIEGCTNANATNYNPEANVSDGSCEYAVSGCSDPAACNYGPLVDTDDGSCQYGTCDCTDEYAINYNPEAVEDDGSCAYLGNDTCDNPYHLEVNQAPYFASTINSTIDNLDISCDQEMISDVWFSFTAQGDSTQVVITPQAIPGEPGNFFHEFRPVALAVYDGCGGETIGCEPIWGYYLTVEGNSETFVPGNTYYVQVWPDQSQGSDFSAFRIQINSFDDNGNCTDPTACNFNPEATVDDGSCYFGIDGEVCNDAQPLEVNGDAEIVEFEHGTCYPQSLSSCSYGGYQQNHWYSFVAMDGPMIIETFAIDENQNIDTILEIYESCEGASIGCSDDFDQGYFSGIETEPGELIPGNTYYVNVYPWGGWFIPGYTFALRVSDVTYFGCTDETACNYEPDAEEDDGSCDYAIAHDTCELALPLEANAGDVIADNTGNSCDGPLAESECYIPNAEDVWFSFVAGFGTTTIETSDSGLMDAISDLVMVIWDDCNGNEIACNDDYNDLHPGIAGNNDLFIEGETYYVQISPYIEGTQGTFRIQVTTEVIQGCTNPLACNYNEAADEDDGSCIETTDYDICQLAQPLSINAPAFEANNMNNLCDGPASLCTPEFGTDVWFSFVAEQGVHSITVASGNGVDPVEDLAMSIYLSCDDDWVMLCDDNSGEGQQPFIEADNFWFNVGDTYFIQVYPENGADQGTFTIQINNDSVMGCTDPSACNYLDEADYDDGSCLYGTDCGDFDQNGIVDTADLLMFLNAFGVYGTYNDPMDEDLNEDGQVNAIDLLLFLAFYGVQ